jgi:hypothetical protein
VPLNPTLDPATASPARANVTTFSRRRAAWLRARDPSQARSPEADPTTTLAVAAHCTHISRAGYGKRPGVVSAAMALPALYMPFAHAGHWALWVLYAVPVVVVLVAVGVAVVRERRAQREGAEVSRSPSP